MSPIPQCLRTRNFGRMVTQLQYLVPIKLIDSLVTSFARSCDKLLRSSFNFFTKLFNQKSLIFLDHVTNQKHNISTTTTPLATKLGLGSTHYEELPITKLYDLSISQFCDVRSKVTYLISPLSLTLRDLTNKVT